jgi:hypothetical protein
MHTLQVMVDTSTWTRAWGLGLILERRGDRILAGHTGAMPGFQSVLFLHRSTGIVVAALANVTRGIKLADLATEVVEEAIAAQPPGCRARLFSIQVQISQTELPTNRVRTSTLKQLESRSGRGAQRQPPRRPQPRPFTQHTSTRRAPRGFGRLSRSARWWLRQ